MSYHPDSPTPPSPPNEGSAPSLLPPSFSLPPSPPGSLLLDNWTLQCAGTFLQRGLTGGSASELVLTKDGLRFRYVRRSEDIVNVRSLFQALEAVVFGETLFVDQDSAGTWADVAALIPLLKKGVIVAQPFQSVRDQWVPARERFIAELCVGPSMRDLHRRNVARYAARGEGVDAFFAQLIWGGAGMMGRADAMGIPYVAHPLRHAWFRRIGRLFGPPSAQQRLQSFATEQRVHVLKRADQTGFLARLCLPPIAALAVQEATSLDEVVPIALQLRREYAPLRKWIGEFQAAMDAGEPKTLLEREKVLQSVGRHIEAVCSAFPVGDTTLQIGTSWLRTSIKAGDPINTLRNHFGVRAMINRLVLAPAGYEVVRQLARLCGEKRSQAGRDFEHEFLRWNCRS